MPSIEIYSWLYFFSLSLEQWNEKCTWSEVDKPGGILPYHRNNSLYFKDANYFVLFEGVGGGELL